MRNRREKRHFRVECYNNRGKLESSFDVYATCLEAAKRHVIDQPGAFQALNSAARANWREMVV